VDRICYRIAAVGGQWQVLTSAPWPDALARSFASREEALAVATIAARVEWMHKRTPTCVCVADGSDARIEQLFG
jgi:hypothetical protein